MIAAKKAYEDAGELQKLQKKLAYDQQKERFEIWLHRKQMIERAARLRQLERMNTENTAQQANLKIEMEAKLRETKRKQVEEARKAAEKMRIQIEEAAARAREIRARSEDARRRAEVKGAVEKAILEQQDIIKIK